MEEWPKCFLRQRRSLSNIASFALHWDTYSGWVEREEVEWHTDERQGIYSCFSEKTGTAFVVRVVGEIFILMLPNEPW